MPRVLLLTALAALLTVSARGADIAIEAVEVGFDGAYRAGEWTPLAVRLAGSGALPDSVVVETVTADADGTMVVRTTEPLPVKRHGSEHIVRTVFQSGRLGSDLTVRLRGTDRELLAERRFRAGADLLPAALPKGARLWVTAGEYAVSPDNEAEPTLPLPQGMRVASVRGELPTDRLALSAADGLIVRGDVELSPEQAKAVRRWVAGGGHLAVALGRFTDEFRSGPMAGWVPIEVGESVPLRDVSALENFPRRARVRVAQFRGAAKFLPRDAETPLVARAPYGFGVVTLFAMDLDAPPFSTWAGLPALVGEALLGEDEGAGRGRRITSPGVTDLATQLARAEQQFEGVERPTVGSALLLLLLYAAIVGPLDYLLVHRLLRRPALTWLTLPLIVVGAVWWLHRTAIAANGTVSRTNELHLLDIDAETGTLRGRTAVTLYATESTRTSLTVTPRSGSDWGGNGEAVVPRLAWFAPPESTFGGTFREASGGLFHPEYLIPPPDGAARAEAVPMLVWASRHFEATWQRGDADGLVEADLVTRGRGLLEGTIRHHLPGPVRDYVVVFGNRILRPAYEAEWYPGEPIDVGSPAFNRQDLDSFLTRKTTTRVERKPGEGGADYIVSESAYDPLSTDLGNIVTMLTFHEAAGGSGYTGLTNDALADADLTSRLRLGRAVVLGTLDVPPANVEVTAQEGGAFESARRTTFVRLVLPAAAAGAELPTTLPPLAPTNEPNPPREPRPE